MSEKMNDSFLQIVAVCWKAHEKMQKRLLIFRWSMRILKQGD